MNRHFWSALCAGLAAMSTTGAQAASGEYWEISTKMEMAGMPFAMPATTVKVCIPAGGEKNPQQMQKKDDKCQMTDVKTSGNKVTWKAKCVHDGETMNGTGESIHERDSYRGSMHLTGQSGGHAFDMTQNYNGRKLGGACDPEAVTSEAPKTRGKSAKPGQTSQANHTSQDQAESKDASAAPNPSDLNADTVREGAKKLKGMFGL